MSKAPKTFHNVVLIDPAPPTRPVKVTSLSVGPDELTAIAKKWFSLDVANGDAQTDTIKTYIYHFNKWLQWCIDHGVNPGTASEDEVMEYRRCLVEQKLSSSTIQLKLVAMRRFYHSAHRNGLINFNPVADVKAPPDRRVKNRTKNFSKNQAEALSEIIPKGGSLKALRDRAMIALMFVEGLRRVSVMRANIQEMTPTAKGAKLLVHGKGSDYEINLSVQTVEILNTYIMARGRINGDEHGEPLIATVSKWKTTGHKRIGRSAISKETDKLLHAAGIKEPGKGPHALRHTCGHLLWIAHQDLKKVQLQLGHAGLEMAAKYSSIEDAANAQISESIPVDMRE
jgi:integrase/recombinase XerC/integrase/recombinase XerD